MDKTARLGLWLLGGSSVLEPDRYNALMKLVDSHLPVGPPDTYGGTWRGTYSVDTAYKKLDCVVSQGRTYAALQDTAGNEPTASPDFWLQVTVVIGPPPLPRVYCS